MIMTTRYKTHGKLLITGEYLVLYGAKALSIPVRFSQWADVSKLIGEELPVLIWEARNSGQPWFSATFDKYSMKIIETNDSKKAERLKDLLLAAQNLNDQFLEACHSYKVITDTDFPVEWGLGTSSSIIANIASWANVNLFDLFFSTSTGSGFDIATSISDSPILYRIEGQNPVIQKIGFLPPFYNSLYFIYSGKKQNTVSSIKKFIAQHKPDQKIIERIDAITERILKALDLTAFETAIHDHEMVISELLKKPPIKKEFFSDYEGEIKSLGAWGGDFIMATWRESYAELMNYFYAKGLNTIIPYNEMIL